MTSQDSRRPPRSVLAPLGQKMAVPMIAMPRIELPAGIDDAEVTGWDRETYQSVREWTFGVALGQARARLRKARRLQRRASGRPAGKRRKGERELVQASGELLSAGVCCGLAEILKAGMTIMPERIARVREQCARRRDEEIGRYAVDVENWIRDLAGETRLTRA